MDSVNPSLSEIREGTTLMLQADMVTVVDVSFGHDGKDMALCLMVRRHATMPYVVAKIDDDTLAVREWRQGHYCANLERACDVFWDACDAP